MERIPTDTYIHNLLDPVSPEEWRDESVIYGQKWLTVVT
jgi:hypothetical protein